MTTIAKKPSMAFNHAPHKNTGKTCPSTTSDKRRLDESCGGDAGWEERMKLLNPNWQPTYNSLWNVWHE